MRSTVHYRVEHHLGHTVRVLAHRIIGFAHLSTLTPFVSQLLHDGGGGWVVLVHAETGVPVARRWVRETGNTGWVRAGSRRGDGWRN